MPRPCRFEYPDDLRFLTFSCYQRLPLLSNPKIADAFVERLGHHRTRMRFALIAWVVMPEHVHLMVWPRLPGADVPRILHAIKQPLAQQVLARWKELGAPILSKVTDSRGEFRFWQRGGGHDRNIHLRGSEVGEKLNYIHMNPVRRGLVERPTDWRWSSARWYAGMREGEVQIDRLRKPE